MYLSGTESNWTCVSHVGDENVREKMWMVLVDLPLRQV